MPVKETVRPRLDVPNFQHGTRLHPSGALYFEMPTSFDAQASRLATARLADRQLISEIQIHNAAQGPLPETSWGMTFWNPMLAEMAREQYTSVDLANIGQTLQENGALDLHIVPGNGVVVDLQSQEVLIVSATPAETFGDMSSKVWVRDQGRAGKSRFEKWLYKRALGMDRESYVQDGREAHDILMSTMHLMSTQPQLDRFSAIIEDEYKDDKERAKTRDYRNFPQIAMEMADGKLGSDLPTNWRHPQDAWQMLGITLLDAMDNELINPDELLEGNKQFFASMMPFLAAIDFTKFESSGPWEERRAVMTSVIGVETRLLHKIRQHADKPGFEFLAEGFEHFRGDLPADLQDKSFDDALDIMIRRGLTTIGQQLPFESPGYPKDSIKYREADASLLNLLDYDIPALLAEYETPIKCGGNHAMGERAIEDLLLEQVDTLHDNVTNGDRRYGIPGEKRGRDTYLGPGYNMNERLQLINGEDGLKERLDQAANGGPVDLDMKAELREEIVPDGEAAAWVIPPAQKGAWAARKLLNLLIADNATESLSIQDIQRYDRIARNELNNTLANVTGYDEVQPMLNGNGFCEVKPVTPFRIPECRWRIVPGGDINDIVASPNTPLNWPVGLTAEMIEIYTLAKQTQEKFGQAA